jgi:fumarylpyruvate hydrolase
MLDRSYVFPPTVTIVPVEGTDSVFPVRRIYCVGRNYAEHIREMGGDARQPPFFFQKPADAIVRQGATIPYPSFTADFQHEIELVLAIGRGGIDINEADAADHVFGVAIGIDLTRRDVQVEARKAGRPWEVGKSFDQSSPISDIRPLDNDIPATGRISLSINGAARQVGDLSEMIWKPREVIAQLSRQYRLEPGDLIYTGTPAGVGPMNRGDRVEGQIDGLGVLTIHIG